MNDAASKAASADTPGLRDFINNPNLGDARPCVTQIGIIDEITQPGGISTRSLARSIIHRADPALLFYLTDPVYDVVGFRKSSEGIDICGARRTS